MARRMTRCAHFVRYAQTGCAKSVYEARCARRLKAALLGATHSAPAGHPLPLKDRLWTSWRTTVACRKGLSGRGAACV